MQFRAPYQEVKKTKLNYTNKFEDIFEEIPPYAIDKKTGDFLNKTNLPILKKVGVRNIQENIQSFADDCDIYKILERVALSGDESILRQRVGLFSDFVNLPDNINDLNAYVKNVTGNKDIDNEVIKIALNEALTSKEIVAKIGDYVTKKVDLSKKLTEVKTNE